LRTDNKPPESIDEYIAQCPAEVRPILEKVRATIRKAAPNANEKISYGMPAFALEGNLVYFAAWKEHIGFYPPVPRGDAQLMKDASIYAGPKGNLQFPLNKPIPYLLISRIVRARVQENLQRAEARKKTKSQTAAKRTVKRR
jgi:uncharacterized protein YdhG (YjbR/CyaY superfamily)